MIKTKVLNTRSRPHRILSCFIRLCVLFAALAVSSASANDFAAPLRTPPKHATRVSLDEGLSQSTVSAILQARDGMIWFATGDGVSVFDGVTFTYLFRKFGALDGLQSNNTRALFQDASGAIWVGTLGGGLSKFDENGTHLANFHTANNTLPSDDIYDITQSPDGAIWVATATGVARLLPEETTFIRIYSLPRETVKALLALPDGTVLIGTKSNGLIRLAPEDRESERFTTQTSLLPGNAITSLVQDRASRVWIGVEDGETGGKRNGGLARYTPETNTIDTPITLPDPDIQTIAEGFDGRMWFGSWSNGIFVWDPVTGAVENYRASPTIAHRLASNTILSLAPDQTGRMWAGSYDAGAASLSQFPDRFTSLAADPTGREGPRSGVIKALAEGPANALWIGTKEGLYRLDRATDHLAEIVLRAGAPSDVRALIPDEEGVLIAARPQGLIRYDIATRTTRPITAPDAPDIPLLQKEFIRLMMRDTQGRLWVGTRDGLILLAPDNSQLARFVGRGRRADLPSPDIRALYESPDGRIWIGTGQGIARFLPETNSFDILSGPALLPDNDVRALLQIDARTLLAATGGGLARIDLPSQSARFILRDEGLPNEALYSLLPDSNGDIWITTNNGLARYSPQTDAIQSFDTRDGLPANEFNFNAFADMRDGMLAVGGVNGVALFDPARLAPNPIPPVTSLRVMSPLPQGMSPRALDVTIGLRHFDDPDSNILRWRLDPVDSDWSQNNGPTQNITRANLPAGDYTLRFIAISANGAIAPEEQFHFTVARSRLQSWYAYLGYTALLFMGIWMLASLRFAQISRRNNDLRVQVSDQTRALEDANLLLQGAAVERASFYARTAHEIRTPLSLIKAPLQKILTSPTLAPQERRLLQMIERASKRMMQLIDEMAMVAQIKTPIPARQDTVDLGRFLAPIIALYRDAAAANGQPLTIMHEGPNTVTLDVGAAETIAHNMLSNAVRHAPTGSPISFSTRVDDVTLSLRVHNEGPPLPATAVATLKSFASSKQSAPAARGLELIGAALHNAAGTLTLGATQVDITATLPAYSSAREPLPPSRAARILIVEDDAELREYLISLTSAIAAPTGVGSLKAARRAVLRGAYELVICDVVLPDGSGFDFAQDLKTAPETSHIALVFLTALADRASYHEGLKSWSDDYLTKPFDAEDLLHKLRIRLRARDRLRAHLENRIVTPEALAKEDNIAPLDQRFLVAFQTYLDANFSSPDASLQEAAKHCAMSKRALQRKLETLFAKGFGTLLKEARMGHANTLLRAGHSVTDTAERCGYTTLSSFSRQFKDHFGQSPRAFVRASPIEE